VQIVHVMTTQLVPLCSSSSLLHFTLLVFCLNVLYQSLSGCYAHMRTFLSVFFTLSQCTQ
jgi:hypothetical protein